MTPNKFYITPLGRMVECVSVSADGCARLRYISFNAAGGAINKDNRIDFQVTQRNFQYFKSTSRPLILGE